MPDENISSRLPLTPRDAAKLLHIHHVTLAKMRYQGRGPAYVKYGGLVYYFIDDILEWLEKNRVRPGRGADRRRSQNAAVSTEERGRSRKVVPVENSTTASAGLTNAKPPL